MSTTISCRNRNLSGPPSTQLLNSSASLHSVCWVDLPVSKPGLTTRTLASYTHNFRGARSSIHPPPADLSPATLLVYIPEDVLTNTDNLQRTVIELSINFNDV